jgi:hypothetical protein
MIWYFTRGAAHIDLEVHRLGGSTGYTFAVTYPDGAEQIESFSDPARLVTRVLSFQQKLIADGWMPSSTDGGPVSLGRRPIRRRQMYLVSARKTVRRIRRSVSRRLAAAFGL